MLPTGIVRGNLSPRRDVCRRTDGFDTGLPVGGQPVCRSIHFELHAPVPGVASTPLEPHHRNPQAPAPYAIRTDEWLVPFAARIEISIFPRLRQARLLTTVHADLSAGCDQNFSEFGGGPDYVASTGAR